jgi:hypothetical protein
MVLMAMMAQITGVVLQAGGKVGERITVLTVRVIAGRYAARTFVEDVVVALPASCAHLSGE